MEKQEDEESMGQSKVNEEVEKLLKELRLWELETKSILGLLRHGDDVDGSLVDTLQV